MKRACGLAVLLTWPATPSAAQWHQRANGAIAWTRSNNDLTAGAKSVSIIMGDLARLTSRVGADDFVGRVEVTCSSEESFLLFFSRKVVHHATATPSIPVPELDLEYQPATKSHAAGAVQLKLTPGKTYYFVAPFDGWLAPQTKSLTDADQLLKQAARDACARNGWQFEESAPPRPPLPDSVEVELIACTSILSGDPPCPF